MIDTDNILARLREFNESPEGIKYFQDLAIRSLLESDILDVRLSKVEKYLELHGIEEILSRLIKEHDEAYRDKCYDKGYEPNPNHKFNLLYTYIERNYAQIENQLIPQDFLGSSYFFKGYWFTVYCGQGCFTRVYDSNLETILQI